MTEKNQWPWTMNPYGPSGSLARLLCSAILVSILLAGITALILYLIYRPSHPHFSILSTAIYQLGNDTASASVPATAITTTMQFTILVRNTNDVPRFAMTAFWPMSLTMTRPSLRWPCCHCCNRRRTALWPCHRCLAGACAGVGRYYYGAHDRRVLWASGAAASDAWPAQIQVRAIPQCMVRDVYKV